VFLEGATQPLDKPVAAAHVVRIRRGQVGLVAAQLAAASLRCAAGVHRRRARSQDARPLAAQSCVVWLLTQWRHPGR
jgi:hypothetical protein